MPILGRKEKRDASGHPRIHYGRAYEQYRHTFAAAGGCYEIRCALEGHRYLRVRASNLILLSSGGRSGDGRRSYLLDWMPFIQAGKGGLYLNFTR